MAVNKVTYAGQTVIDISDSTVTPQTLLKDVVAYNKDGERIVGVAEYVTNMTLTEVNQAVTSGTQFTYTLQNYDSQKSHVCAYLNGLRLSSSEYSVSAAGVVTLTNTITGSGNSVIIEHWKVVK